MLQKFREFLQEDKEYFSECQDNITARNRSVLKKACILYACVLGSYSVLTILTDQPQILRTMYYVFDVVHLLLCAAVYWSFKQNRTGKRSIQVLCACLEVSLLCFFALEGVFADVTQHSLYIPIAILLVLLIFIHTAAYALILTDLYVLSFAVLARLYKTPEAYTNDIYIALATLISANIGYYLIAQMRHSEGAALYQFEKLSKTDQLTRVLNKASIMAICEQILLDDERACAFIFVDLDDFKSVNDRFGHGVGDEVLKAVSQEIKASFRETDFVGRFGGDEFIVLMDNCDNIDIVKGRIEALLSRVGKLSFSEEGLAVQCSVGIAQKHKNDTVNTLFQRADTALYQAKSNRKGHYYIGE